MFIAFLSSIKSIIIPQTMHVRTCITNDVQCLEMPSQGGIHFKFITNNIKLYDDSIGYTISGFSSAYVSELASI